jgi:O-6-methylguanine DNA methyltransferase
MELYYSSFKTAAGWIAVLASADGLLKNTLPQETESKALSMLGTDRSDAVISRDMFAGLQKRFIDYFSGIKVAFPESLDFGKATPFRKEVWQASRSIPYGETVSYRWVAEKIGNPKAARAVGGALGKNPMPIIVPCHRVIGCNGDLTGFSSGLDVKKRLLEIEGVSRKPLR